MALTEKQLANLFWETLDKSLTEAGLGPKVELGSLLGRFEYEVGSRGEKINVPPPPLDEAHRGGL